MRRQKVKLFFYHPLNLSLTVFILGLAATVFTTVNDHRIRKKNEVQLAYKSLAKVKASLEQAFYPKFSSVLALEAFVLSHDHPDDHYLMPGKWQEEFNSFAEPLEKEIKGLLSLQLAPSGIVTYLTNVERNQKAIGDDLLKDQRIRESILKTIRERSLMVTGPMEIHPGEEAIIARKAIFIEGNNQIFNPNSVYQEKRANLTQTWPQEIPRNFWGFVTVVIEAKQLYKEAGLNDLPPLYQYALKRHNVLGKEGEVFWGNPEVFDHPLAEITINLPQGEWIMGIKLTRRVLISPSIFIFLLGTIFFSLISALIYFNYSNSQSYQKKLRKTIISGLRAYLSMEKLTETTKNLQAEINQIKRSERDLKLINRELNNLNCLDILTGISNRGHFEQIFDHECRKIRIYKQQNIRPDYHISLILADIDHFKQFNDNYGHLAGDKCIQQVAQALKKTIRASDFLARYGGEEFVILLANHSLEAALEVAEKLRKKVLSLNIPHEYSSTAPTVTLSLGVACFNTRTYMTGQALINYADKALYVAKRQGRNQVQRYWENELKIS